MATTLKFGNGQWATKEGSTLAYNDENGNFKPLPFNFTRDTGATRVNKEGLIETVGNNEPRIDFKDDSNGSLLLEPSRTNLITQSESFDNAYWTKSGSSVTSGFVSPKGDLSAFKLVEDSANSSHSVYASAGALVSNVYSFSTFIKKGERYKCAIADRNIGAYASFNLNDGTIIEQVGMLGNIELLSNDWYKISISNASNTTIFVTQIFILEDSYTTGTPILLNYTGNGTSGIYIYGAQLEQGSYSTSYIPTQGSIGTRVAESFSTSLPDTASFNSSNGFSVISKFGIGNAGSGTTSLFMSFNDDTSNTYIGFGSTASNFRCRLNLNGVAYLNTQGNAQRTQENSLFISCDANGWSQGANGVTNDTGNQDASVYNRLASISCTTSELYGIIRIKELSVYNTRLTNAELQSLTKI